MFDGFDPDQMVAFTAAAGSAFGVLVAVAVTWMRDRRRRDID